MLLSTIRAACLSAAAFSLSIIAQATWPARYTVGPNDAGQAIAVDHRGNVYVCGQVGTLGGGLDWGIVKYDAAGTQVWATSYNGPTSGDDIPTAIACDWKGNVYVAGVVTSNLGSAISTKFAALKLDQTTGIPIWPTSGSGGSGSGAYVYSHGAIILADNRIDGNDPVTNLATCSMSIENVDGDQPTFVISGPSSPASTEDGGTPTGYTFWRTVVFQDATSGGVSQVAVKAGWPVDEFGLNNHDVPYGVAIYPDDDTVYVTGGVHNNSTSEHFTTVHYYADGTDHSVTADEWVDDWHTEDGKPGRGRAIVLDAGGDAYVTGDLLESDEDTEMGTRRISAAPVGGVSHPVWWKCWDNANVGDHDEGTSIDLTYEVDSEGALQIYVTSSGVSKHTYHGNWDVVTLRYRGSDGNPEWSGPSKYSTSASTYIGSDYFPVLAPKEVTLGLGETYVVSSTNSDSTSDYVLIPYKQDGTTRHTVSPVDGTGGQDMGQAVVMGLAGSPFYTGSSYGGSTSGTDFMTVNTQETPTSVTYPSMSVSVHSGLTSFPSTTISNTAADDGTYYILRSTPTGIIDVTFQGTVSLSSTPTEISFTMNSHANSSTVVEKLKVYDRIAGAYVDVSDMAAPVTTDGNTVIVLKSDPMRYIDPSSHAVKMEVSYTGTPNYEVSFDLVRWDVLY